MARSGLTGGQCSYNTGAITALEWALAFPSPWAWQAPKTARYGDSAPAMSGGQIQLDGAMTIRRYDMLPPSAPGWQSPNGVQTVRHSVGGRGFQQNEH
jgi:hypothetical protein